jgi:hypothetical protein
MSAFIISPPETTVWRVTPEALAQRIASRWPDAEVCKREHAAPHEALYFRLTDGGSRVEGWLATSGQSAILMLRLSRT